MTLDGISPIAAEPIDGAGAQRSATPAIDFADWLKDGAVQANDKMINADRLVQKLALGEVDNLHQVMLALDEAKFSFNVLVQIRNKLLEAYQDVMRMSV